MTPFKSRALEYLEAIVRHGSLRRRVGDAVAPRVLDDRTLLK